ncbi:hypothetical protein Cpin_4931 [Chitinophaga pinensis DSM 2588]|uniref:Uncharacterized protein n=2 Tax=Chitinophaga pinensis TaxID=79329 RepID=A0A979G7I6_CHIPD|nr:hypothetical protein Cpin_4931 [Chitinophaga pinensis DSM 2588]
MKRAILFQLLIMYTITISAQSSVRQNIKHVEPLQVDLIQDLNARKGDRQLEIDFDIDLQQRYNAVSVELEYEHTFSQRLGMELAVPLSVYGPKSGYNAGADLPHNKIEGLKLGLQYTFSTIQRARTTMALALIHESHFHSFTSMKKGSHLIKGYSETAAFVAARRWGKRIHTMLYTGPEWEVKPGTALKPVLHGDISIHWQVAKRQFIGVEYVYKSGKEAIPEIYPQLKMALTRHTDICLAAAIPAKRTQEGMNIQGSLEIKL